MPRGIANELTYGLEDQLVAAGVCAHGDCDTPAMDQGQLPDVMAPAGMCKFHTLRAVMETRRRDWPSNSGAYRDAEPYVRWVRAALDSGTVTYRELSLTSVDRFVLAALVGVSQETVTNIRKGAYGKIKARTARLLDPYVNLTTTSSATGLQVGDRVTYAQLFRLPRGTVVLDNYRRAWQYRNGMTRAAPAVWYPAHGLTTSDDPASRQVSDLGHGPRLPASILWIPGKPLKGLTR